MQKIGLFGGTFDPIHLGHLQLADIALQEVDLDWVMIIPASDPPHKEIDSITSFKHRAEMARLAISGHQFLKLCLIEAEMPEPSYTIDTVTHLQNIHDNDVHFYFIIGMDAFVDILSWKSYQDLVCRVHLVVANRAGGNDQKVLDELAAALGYDRQPNLWQPHGNQHPIRFLGSSPDNFSSTAIREALVKAHKDVAGLNSRVEQYIYKNSLYQTAP